MHDALDERLVARVPTGEVFRKRFGNPYAVIHRADVHMSLLEGAQESGRDTPTLPPVPSRTGPIASALCRWASGRL
jgi:hypothetical protein